MKKIAMRVDIGGRDKIPHTFLVIKNEKGSYDEYGFIPQKEHALSGSRKIETKLNIMQLLIHYQHDSK